MQAETHREREMRQQFVAHEPSDTWHFEYKKFTAQTSNPNLAPPASERMKPLSLAMWFLVGVCLAMAIGVPLAYVLIAWGVGR